MSFFKSGPKLGASACRNADMFNRWGCKACPLRNELGTDMLPLGSSHPEVYMLGAAPSRDDIRTKKLFSNQEGRMVRMRIPPDWIPKLRWNNVVRTPTPEGRKPIIEEMESCRRSIEDDIMQTKPKAIFGFGPIPLRWALKQSGIGHWSGRGTPIKVGTHQCWYFPFTDPAAIIDSYRPGFSATPNRYGSEMEFGFAMDLKRAFALVKYLPLPEIHTREIAEANIEFDTACDEAHKNSIITFIRFAYNAKIVGFDYETNMLRPYSPDSKILTVAMSTQHGTMAFPLRHRQATWSDKHLEEIENELERFLLKAPCRKVVHNLAFELEWTAAMFDHKALRAQPWGCSQVQAYILDERQKQGGGGHGPQALAFLTQQYFGIDIKAIDPVNRKDIDAEPLAKVLPYNGVDAKYHRLVYLQQAARIKHEKLVGVYKEHLRRIPTMVLTQRKGVPINQEACRELFTKYYKRRENVARKIADLKVTIEFKEKMGYDYRPGATRDAAVMVEDLLPRKLTRKALDPRTGKLIQADDKTLKEIDHPIMSMSLRWRKHNKVLSTYIEPVMEACKILDTEVKQSPHIFPDGLGHPILHTLRTVTTRTSAHDYNYQNWPKRDGERKEVRRQVGKPGHKVVSFDYAGIQARNVAMESKDKALVKAFWDRYDIHSDWTERVIKLYPAWFSEGLRAVAKDKDLFKGYRNKAKNQFVFPSFFGAQPKSMARNMGIPINIVTRLHGDFWEAFPDIKGWHTHIMSFYKRHGYVTGLSGYRRRAPISPNELINAPIQADESIIVCTAMSELSELDNMDVQANMEIHDDLTFVWPIKEVDKNAEIVLDHMLNPPFEWAHIVPIGVEMSIGDDWYAQKGAGEYFSDKWKGQLLKTA